MSISKKAYFCFDAVLFFPCFWRKNVPKKVGPTSVPLFLHFSKNETELRKRFFGFAHINACIKFLIKFIVVSNNIFFKIMKDSRKDLKIYFYLKKLRIVRNDSIKFGNFEEFNVEFLFLALFHVVANFNDFHVHKDKSLCTPSKPNTSQFSQNRIFKPVFAFWFSSTTKVRKLIKKIQITIIYVDDVEFKS